MTTEPDTTRSHNHDRVTLARDYFCRCRGNCAQAILHAFADVFAISREEIAAARHIGSGRAEGGYCGALWAALRLVGDGKREHLCERFRARTGALTCRDVRRARNATCAECVTVAAQAVCAVQKPHTNVSW